MAGGGVSYVVYTSLVRRAPVLEDVPHDSVVAEPGEEIEDGYCSNKLRVKLIDTVGPVATALIHRALRTDTTGVCVRKNLAAVPVATFGEVLS